MIVVAAVFGLYYYNNAPQASGQYDEFAQCLTQKGVKMYGAYWCPHCNNQKKAFAGSWKHIDYIECSLPNKGGQSTTCQEADIQAYPTWELPDGQRIEGELSMKRLSELSGCTLE